MESTGGQTPPPPPIESTFTDDQHETEVIQGHARIGPDLADSDQQQVQSVSARATMRFSLACIALLVAAVLAKQEEEYEDYQEEDSGISTEGSSRMTTIMNFLNTLTDEEVAKHLHIDTGIEVKTTFMEFTDSSYSLNLKHSNSKSCIVLVELIL